LTGQDPAAAKGLHEKEMRKAAKRIVEKLRLHGYEAYFAGGWVRDFLLRRKPQDIDIATSALPDEVLRIFPHATPIGAKFGVVQVRTYGHTYDVATFRSEGPYLDGRHPSSVSFSGPEQDAMRRDFTVNGLFYDPVELRVIDFVRGEADLHLKVLRTIGKPEERFGEDKLRMLRAVRFSCHLDFKIAEETFEAIRQLAPSILEVSWERIRDELLKILMGPAPGRGLDLLNDSGLLQPILPEVAATRGVEQPAEFHPEGDVWIHTRMMLEGLPEGASPTLAWGVLLHDVGKPPTFQSAAETGDRIRFNNHVEVGVRMAEAICRRLRFSTEDTQQIAALVANHMKFGAVEEMRKATLKRFVRQSHFDEHLALHRLDCLSSHRNLDSFEFVKRFLAETPPEQVRPERLLGGDELLELGYHPGPQFAEILRSVEDAQLEGLIRTQEEARKYVLGNFTKRKSAG
jgi:poly(A) polymerase